MSTRKLALAPAMAGATAIPFSAMAGSNFIYRRGEAGFRLPDTPSTLTRAQKIAQDRAESAAEAAQLSGWRWVGGQLGWAYEGHKYAWVGGKFVCVDGIDHSTTASYAPVADPWLYMAE